MSPVVRRSSTVRALNKPKVPKSQYEKYLNRQFLESLIFDPKKIAFSALFFLVLEIFINIFVIHRVPYTEIDWKAYMQEVEGVINGTLDYAELKGDTGPLVYPAGFVYVFSILYFITYYGTNLRLAQYLYAALYILTLALVFRLYVRSKKVPPYMLFFMCCTSYRIHSIYVLRLFNDPVAIVLLYAALNLFLDEKWSWGSFVFSLAVSIKMNILLYAPALLIAYLTKLGFKKTIIQLFICGITQLILGLPFLIANPVSYISGAFNLGRIFLYEWTVNWRFLPEDIFVSRTFHLTLLAVHAILLLICIPLWLQYLRSYTQLRKLESDVKSQLKKSEKAKLNTGSSSQLFLTPLFFCNFIGIVCSRSLHYQFYVWYFHTLPYLLWTTPFPVLSKLCLLGIIELCWNTYPSTTLSSIALLICHIFLTLGVIKTQRIVSYESNKVKKATE